MSSWTKAQEDYANLINSVDHDSRYLRERGVIPNVLELVGMCSGATVLDAGTGTGWIFDYISPQSAHAVDLVKPKTLPEWVEFRQNDVSRLSYSDEGFDIIIGCLLLMFCPDLNSVLKEFQRVAKPSGRLILALTHPYFYRTGRVLPNGQFLLEKPLSIEHEFDLRIGGLVGPLRYFYRPMPTYFNGLVQTGWKIVETVPIRLAQTPTIRSMLPGSTQLLTPPYLVGVCDNRIGTVETRDWFIEMDDYIQHHKSCDISRSARSGTVPLYSFIKATKCP